MARHWHGDDYSHDHPKGDGPHGHEADAEELGIPAAEAGAEEHETPAEHEAGADPAPEAPAAEETEEPETEEPEEPADEPRQPADEAGGREAVEPVTMLDEGPPPPAGAGRKGTAWHSHRR